MNLNILVHSDLPLTLPRLVNPLSPPLVNYEDLLKDVLTPPKGPPLVTYHGGNVPTSYDQGVSPPDTPTDDDTDDDYVPNPRPPTRRSTRDRKRRVPSLYGSYVGPSLNA